MYKIDFNEFKIRNPNPRKAFEELCYHLFCRKFRLSEGIRADFNEVGLETKPVFFQGKHYGFQSKFFDHTNSGEQIKASIKKAIKAFKNNLDVVYIYLNNPIGSRAEYDKDVEKIAAKHNIQIEWVVPSNFTKLLNKPPNFNLTRLYFGVGDEFGFIKSSADLDMTTLVQASVYQKLPLKGLDQRKDLAAEILRRSDKVTLLLGNPGSGKTVLMNGLLVNFGGLDKDDSDEMKSIIEKNKALPMLINLKDCTNSSIENIIRDRKNDY